jgi:hypothetical protein
VRELVVDLPLEDDVLLAPERALGWVLVLLGNVLV